LQGKFGNLWEKMAIYVRNGDFRILHLYILIIMYFINYI
jgi:hypothetical protein